MSKPYTLKKMSSRNSGNGTHQHSVITAKLTYADAHSFIATFCLNYRFTGNDSHDASALHINLIDEGVHSGIGVPRDILTILGTSGMEELLADAFNMLSTNHQNYFKLVKGTGHFNCNNNFAVNIVKR